MNKMIAAAIVLLGLGANASALDLKGKVEAGLGLVDSIPMSSDFKDMAKSAVGVNVYADYNITEAITAGLEYTNVSYDMKGNMSSTDLTSSIFGVRGKYVMPMNYGSHKGSVYGMLGIANYNIGTDPKAVDSTNHIGLNIGAGADVNVGYNIVAGLEVRYHLTSAYAQTLNSLSPMLKVGYKF